MEENRVLLRDERVDDAGVEEVVRVMVFVRNLRAVEGEEDDTYQGVQERD